jgi:hypothetical protein
MLFVKSSCLLTVFSLALSNFASTNGMLKGKVTDSEGAAIRHATVRVHWDESGARVGLKSNVGIKEDLTVNTNEGGEFSIELPPGFYDVFISANAFTPQCRKVRVRSGEIATFSPKLNADPLVTKELGDRF